MKFLRTVIYLSRDVSYKIKKTYCSHTRKVLSKDPGISEFLMNPGGSKLIIEYEPEDISPLINLSELKKKCHRQYVFLLSL